MKAYSEEVKRQARKLYVPGVWGIKAISRDLGVPTNTVRRWVNPEYAERHRLKALERKKSYRGTCIDCGKRTSYSGFGSKPSERCQACNIAHEKAKAIWTREAVIDAIQRWAAIHGRPPRARQWVRADSFHHYPCMGSVYGRPGSTPFTTWNEAIEAAGLEPTPPGHYSACEARGECVDDRRRHRLGKYTVSTEEYIARIREASKEGVAPSVEDAKATWQTLRKRGVSWVEACELAGVAPRGRGARRFADRRSRA